MSAVETGIVIATRGRHFEVITPDRLRFRCELRQKVKRAADNTTPVAVGDNVEFIRLGGDTGVIELVQPRLTAFFRPTTGLKEIKQVIAANLDQLGVVVSVNSPPLKTGLIDRFLIAAHVGDMTPIVIVNKVDLERPDNLSEIIATYESAGYLVITTSTATGEGIEALRALLSNHRTLFAGHSGVGKSSLLNTLIPTLTIKTGEVSEYSNKGKHTTTTIEMFEIPSGGYLVDSPGLKLMGLWEVEPSMLPEYYPEFRNFSHACRFGGCSHRQEPDCAVKEALGKGKLSRFRYENYLAIWETL